MRKYVYVVNTCNEWKTYDSFRMVGIFTTRKKLNVVLNRLLKQEDIAWDDDVCTDRFVNNLMDMELSNNLKYVSIEKLTLNEVQ